MSYDSFIQRLSFIVLIGLGMGCENVDKQIPAPKIYMDMPEGSYEMEVGDTLLLEPQILYDYNSVYQWIENDEVFHQEKDLELIPLIHESRDLLFRIENPQGSDQYAVNVSVIILSDFEKFKLSTNSVLYNSADTVEFSDRIAFYPNQADVVAQNWNGYALSNRVSATKSDSTAIFHVNTSAGNGNSKNFGIYHYQPGISNHIRFTDEKLHHLKSIDVCNNLFTAQVVKYGFEKTGIVKFEKGDWLNVAVSGYDAQGALIGSKEVILVDYRFDNPSKYITLSAWKTVDLSGLQGVATVDLVVTSSRSDTPTYVCIDNLKLFN